MKTTGEVVYLNFKFLMTNFSNFEMLYYEKFVANMNSRKGETESIEMYEVLSYIQSIPFYCYLTQT